MDKLEDMQNKFRDFIRERDWEQYHNPKDLALSLMVEAGELLEHFQWVPADKSLEVVEKNREKIGEEMADVLHFLISFSNATGIDLYDAFLDKLKKNNMKYPKELVRGKSHKYTYYMK